MSTSFVATVSAFINDSTSVYIRDVASTATKSERVITKMVDAIFASGGRVAHFVEQANETPEAKGIRLEAVRAWDTAFIAGCSPIQKKALGFEKGKVPEEYKAERKNAQTKVKVYRDRFIKGLNALENPAPAKSEGEGEGEGDKAPKAKKTREEQIVARLQDALKYLQELEGAKFDITKVTHNVETALATIAKSV